MTTPPDPDRTPASLPVLIDGLLPLPAFPPSTEWEAHHTGLSFGDATELARRGRPIARAGWNGKGMYVFVATPLELLLQPSARGTGRVIGTDHGVRPAFFMRDAQGLIVPGWLASQTDMLARDWVAFAPLGPFANDSDETHSQGDPHGTSTEP